MKKLINGLLSGIILFIGIFSLYIAYPEKRELHEAVHPVYSMDGSRIVATSFQASYYGYRVTVTNKHVCDMSKDFLLVDGKFTRIRYVSKSHDLCFLDPLQEEHFLKISEKELKDKDKITLIGFPRGIGEVIREGHVIKIGMATFPWVTRDRALVYQLISAIGYPGNSGSPIIDSEGEVSGVLFAGKIGIYTEVLIVPHRYLVQDLKNYLYE